jgi:hypothetical protein
MITKVFILVFGAKLAHRSFQYLLDTHSGNTARKLGLLVRKQNDAKSVKELDYIFRTLYPNDPVKYDFA